jgi:hypothetical protein
MISPEARPVIGAALLSLATMACGDGASAPPTGLGDAPKIDASVVSASQALLDDATMRLASQIGDASSRAQLEEALRLVRVAVDRESAAAAGQRVADARVALAAAALARGAESDADRDALSLTLDEVARMLSAGTPPGAGR